MRTLIFGNANADINVKSVDVIDPSVDTTFVDDLELTNGGNAMTASVVLSKLGTPCTLATALGDHNDQFSRFLYQKMLNAGVDTSLVEWHEGMTCGCVIVMISSTGKRWFYYKKGVQDVMDLSENVLNSLKHYDIVSINGTFLMPIFDGQGTARLMKAAKDLGKTTVMDLTPDTSGKWLATVGEALKYCDYFMPSEIEARGITNLTEPDQMAHALYAETGAKKVIIKMGERGCYYFDGREEGIVPAFPIQAVDTTGAGDSFCAGFIHGLSQGFSLKQSLVFANAVGAVSCENIGATGGIENVGSIQALLARFGRLHEFE